MKKYLSIFVFITGFCKMSSGQENHVPVGYKLKEQPVVTRVYRSTENNPAVPDTTVWNKWDFDYWFKDEGISYTDTITKATYRRIYIESKARWVKDTSGKWKRSEKPGFDEIIPWQNGEYVDGQDFNTYLWIKESDFKEKVPYYGKPYGRFMISGLTVPFKYRPKVGSQPNSLIDGSINLGTLIGGRMGFGERFGITIGGFIGVSSFAQNASTNNGITNSATETTSGFQYGYSFVFDWQKKTQFGFVAGYDHAVGRLADTYIYQGKQWFAFSLNYKFIDFAEQIGSNTAATNKTIKSNH